MFFLFIKVFGNDFYVAAGVLLGIEIFFLVLKFIKLDSCFKKFAQEEFYNDYEQFNEVDEEDSDQGSNDDYKKSADDLKEDSR